MEKRGDVMYNVGDRVIYPMYGAGVIEDIKNERFDGKTAKYFVLHICLGDLRILIAADNIENLGLKNLLDADEILRVINDTEPISMPNNWMTRYKENSERLRSGDLKSAMQVYKTLILRERIKSLSNREKKMLVSTKKFILSIIILSQNVCKETAEKILLSSVQHEKYQIEKSL
jgi:CarD family transcriptional regulator